MQCCVLFPRIEDLYGKADEKTVFQQQADKTKNSWVRLAVKDGHIHAAI